MKKNLLYLAALACCLMSLTACGSDDEPEVTVNSTYTITFTQDLLEASSVIIYYKENNEDKFQPITASSLTGGTTWTKTVTTKAGKNDAELGCKVQFSAKEAAELTKEKYDLGLTINIASKVSGSTSSYTNEDKVEYIGTKAADVPNMVKNRFNGHSYGYRYNNKGEASTYTPSFGF